MPEKKDEAPKLPRGAPDFGAIGRALLHPTQAEVLTLLAGQRALGKEGKPLSASEMLPSLETDSLAQVSYHCLALLKLRWIKKAGSKRVRGATKQFYVYVPENIKPKPPRKPRKRKGK
jgi:hypothetical protein